MHRPVKCPHLNPSHFSTCLLSHVTAEEMLLFWRADPSITRCKEQREIRAPAEMHYHSDYNTRGRCTVGCEICRWAPEQLAGGTSFHKQQMQASEWTWIFQAVGMNIHGLLLRDLHCFLGALEVNGMHNAQTQRCWHWTELSSAPILSPAMPPRLAALSLPAPARWISMDTTAAGVRVGLWYNEDLCRCSCTTPPPPRSPT